MIAVLGPDVRRRPFRYNIVYQKPLMLNYGAEFFRFLKRFCLISMSNADMAYAFAA
jgi:hypothetical protein